MREHEFSCTWKIDGTDPDELCSVLAEVEQYPRWWPAAFLAGYEIEAPTEGEVGRVVTVESKGFLPAVYRWSLRTTAVERPTRVAFETLGDLEGTAAWSIATEGGTTVATWTWKGQLHRGVMNALGDLFARDQRWAFAQGESSVALELARRRARTDEERTKIDAPPGPTTRSSLPITLGLAGIAGIVAGATVLVVRRPRR